MRHAMLGVGGVGGLVGAALARSGADVVLLMRPESLAAYPGHVHVTSVALGDFEVEVPAAPRLEHEVDVLWVSPKAVDLESALSVVPAGAVSGARVVTLMNGVDHLDVLRARYDHVVAGTIRVESERVAPGQIVQSSPFALVQLESGEDLAQELRAAGITCEVGGDALSILWQKLAFLAPAALVTTAFDIALGEAREREEFRQCQAEVLAVARLQGATVDEAAVHAAVRGALPGMRSSMQKDRAKGLPLEVDAIAGPVVRGGLQHGVPTPATEHLVALIGS